MLIAGLDIRILCRWFESQVVMDNRLWDLKISWSDMSDLFGQAKSQSPMEIACRAGRPGPFIR